jgi:homoserine kinase
LVISGAGPTLLALTDTQQAANVEAAIANAWAEQGITPLVQAVQIDAAGAMAVIEPIDA